LNEDRKRTVEGPLVTPAGSRSIKLRKWLETETQTGSSDMLYRFFILFPVVGAERVAYETKRAAGEKRIPMQTDITTWIDPQAASVVMFRMSSGFPGHLRRCFVGFRSASPSAFSSFSNLRVVVPGDAAEV
ncbi:hypothetical protein CCH79_00015907, partial [Gambusia affinis]